MSLHGFLVLGCSMVGFIVAASSLHMLCRPTLGSDGVRHYSVSQQVWILTAIGLILVLVLPIGITSLGFWVKGW